MAHVFDGKLYFTRDHMQGNFIPKNLKLPEPKPAPKPRAKASSTASSSGEHVQLFRHGGGDSAGPRTPTTPPPGAFSQQLVAKGVALRRPWAPKAPDAP